MNDEIAKASAPESGQPPLIELLKQLVPLYMHLLDAGIARVRVEYDAREDSGGFSIEAFDTASKHVTGRLDPTLVTELTTFFLSLLEKRHARWHSGAGAYGRIEWELAFNRFNHRHNKRLVTIESSDHQGL